MPDLMPHRVTHDTVIRALERGHSVDLDAPGWEDTRQSMCPDCNRMTWIFTGHRSPVRFEYGLEAARKHVCAGQPWESRDWKVRRIEQLHRELDAIRASLVWPDSDPRSRS